MAPGSAKRKRPDRQFSHDDGPGRPSPHRPENMGMAQRDQHSGRGGRGGGNRRQSRQGGYEGVNSVPVLQRSALQPAALQGNQPQQTSIPAGDISRSGTPVPRTATPMQQQSERSVIPRPPPELFAYDYLTDKAVASWPKSGKQDLMDVAKQADEMTLSGIMQEMLRSAVDGRLDMEEVGLAVRQIAAAREDDFDVQTLFLNSISLLEDADTKPNPPKEDTRFARLMAATGFDPDVLRLDLDVSHVVASKLVHEVFSTIRNRKATNLLYRQANFNLLREESEGYAKLITEYYNTAQEAGGTRDVRPNMAEDAFQRVKALVGSFDLDVGRVLDITFDISANALVRSCGFFMTFYRCSSWWPTSGVIDNIKWEDQGFNTFPGWALPRSVKQDMGEEDRREVASLRQARDQRFWVHVRDVGTDAFFELGARRIIDYDSVAQLLATEVEPQLGAGGVEINADRRQRTNENRKYMRETRTLPPQGNPDAAQLLGFKLRYYASDAREADDVMPDNLIHFTALLIKIGFISLRDLYPHLYPADDAMADERMRLDKEKAEKEAKERPGGGPNALVMASALTDDTLPPSQRTRGDKDRSGGATPKPGSKDDATSATLPTPTNQKVALLRALLLLGAIPESLYILGRFPWLAEADVTLPPYLQRIVRHMLSKMTLELSPLQDRPDMSKARDQLADTIPHSDGLLKFASRPAKRPIKWLGLDEYWEKDGVEYRHYYNDWADNVPVCQDAEDVFLLCDTFIGYLGVKIGQDATILGTLIRLAKRSVAEVESDANRQRWLDLTKRLLVPALSLSKHNPGLSIELHELLMVFPIITRYNIYAEWYTGKTSRLPDIKLAFDYNRAEVREVLRRVSNENVKKQRNALGKVSHSSPGVLIMYMINQLESYSNMIPPLVECVEHFSPLALDVLTWCLINSLSGQGRDRIQADGMLTSPWLQALSQFVASLFSHRAIRINPSPILQYLAYELRSGNSTDLEMFEQVLAEMAGIRSDNEFNDAQVLAMSGGEHLQAQTLLQVGDKRHERDRKVTVKRLIKALTESGLVGQTLISIAQERQMYPHHGSSANMPLKVLGNNLDKIQQVFAQYLDVLRTNLSSIDFEAAVPEVTSLIEDYGLEPSIAFTICRNVIAAHIGGADEAKKQEELEERKRRLSETRAQSNGEVEMEDVSSADDATTASTAVTKIEPVLEDGPSQEAKPTSVVQLSTSSGAESAVWHPVLLPIIQRLKELRPTLAERVSPSFFVTFWTLSQSDIIVLTDSYTAEYERIRNQIKDITRDRSDNTSIGARDRDRKKKGLQEVLDNLSTEVKSRVAYYTKVHGRLSHKEKNHWFDRSRAHDDLDNKHIALLQECFLPRAMLSSLDAHYSFLMLKLLHDKGTPGFSTMHLMAQLFRRQELAAIIFQCTALEAQHFGRFLNETLRLLAKWHADKSVYEKEAIGTSEKKLPGFARKMDVNGEPETFMDFETFRRQMYNWHSFLSGALQSCFESGEYMHIRNGIIVLKAICQVFPALNFQGKNMITQVTKLSKEDPRQDLKLMAMSLLGPLNNREKQWVLPQAFRLNDTVKDGKPTSRSVSAKAETPQPDSGAPKLNATAPEFKPDASKLTNGAARQASLTGIEDGEVEEEKQGTWKTANSEMKDAAVVKTEEKQQDSASKPAAGMPAKEPARTESKPATPVPSAGRSQPPATSGARHQSERQASTQPATSHSAQGLPSRPEPRQAPTNRPLPAPPIERPTGRPSGRPDDRYGRLDRPSDVRPESREHSPGSRGRATPPTIASRMTPRDDRSQRSSRDSSWTESRRDAPSSALQSRPQSESRDRPNGSMGPPQSGQPAHPDRAGYISSVVSAPPSQPTSRPTSSGTPAAVESSDDPFTNPARRAMMNGDAKRNVQNQDKDRPRERDSREDRTASSFPLQHDPRSNGRLAQTEVPRESTGRHEQPAELTPSGPRHGRLNRDSRDMSAAGEASYGRLNGPPEVPSGPRGTNGPASARPGRNFSGPPTSLNARSTDTVQPSPTGPRSTEPPGAFRNPPRQPGDRRNSGSSFERQPSSNAAPTTPTVESGPPVHPSRAAQLGVNPPSIQTNFSSTNGSPNTSSPTSAPPTGPRGLNGRAPAGAPTGPSPIANAPPAGPASAVERQRRDRQRANINATLTPSNGVNASSGNGHNFRGAATNGSRQNSFTMSTAPVAPSIQAIASPMEPPMRRNDGQQQHNGLSGRPDSQMQSQADLFQRSGGPDIRGGTRARQHNDERNDSQRSGRGPPNERRPDDEPPRRAPPPGMEDSRERRGPAREDHRPRNEPDMRNVPHQERRDTRRTGRPDENQMNMPNQFNGPPPPDYGRNDMRGPPPPRHGPEDSRRGGRMSGRAEEFRGPRPEDRPDARGPAREEMAPDGRKRRHEEAAFDGAKRRRSGR